MYIYENCCGGSFMVVARVCLLKTYHCHTIYTFIYKRQRVTLPHGAKEFYKHQLSPISIHRNVCKHFSHLCARVDSSLKSRFVYISLVRFKWISHIVSIRHGNFDLITIAALKTHTHTHKRHHHYQHSREASSL